MVRTASKATVIRRKNGKEQEFDPTRIIDFPLDQRKKITYDLILVTPDMALEWLRQNSKNRSASASVIQRYVNDMKSGFWSVTPSPIAFDEGGILIDGQHRLAAIHQTGFTVRCLVTTGWPSAAHLFIDQGKKRSGNDVAKIVASMHLDHVYARLSPIARELASWIVPMLAFLESDSLGAFALSTAEQIPLAEQHAEALAWTADYFAPSGKRSRLTKQGVMGAIAFAYPVAPQPLAVFVHQYITGEGMKKGDPALVLRDYVIAQDGRKEDRMSLALRALNAISAHIDGVSIKLVRAQPKGWKDIQTRRAGRGLGVPKARPDNGVQIRELVADMRAMSAEAKT